MISFRYHPKSSYINIDWTTSDIQYSSNSVSTGSTEKTVNSFTPSEAGLYNIAVDSVGGSSGNTGHELRTFIRLSGYENPLARSGEFSHTNYAGNHFSASYMSATVYLQAAQTVNVTALVNNATTNVVSRIYAKKLI